jgi:multidrug efflux system membrane fusion protein
MSAAAKVSRRRSPRRARLLAWAAAAALATAGCGGDAAASAGSAGQPPSSEELLPVSVARAERKDVPLQLRSVGRVESPASVVLRPQVEGPIVEVRFTEGDEVTAGDVLLRIDDRPFQAELRAAEANLDADTAMARTRSRRCSSSSASRTSCPSARCSARRPARTPRRRRSWPTRPRSTSRGCGSSTARSARRSTGRTGTLEVRVGSVVKENDTRAAHDPADRADPRALLRARAAARRDPGGAGARAAGGRGAGGVGPAREGRLTFIDNAVDSTTGTVRLMATFDNADRALWPGQFVEVQLTLSVEAGAVVVPAPAVQPGQAGPFVFVVTEQGTVEQRPVRVSRTAGGESLIAEGLQGGETVVTAGQLRLSPGVRVSVAP